MYSLNSPPPKSNLAQRLKQLFSAEEEGGFNYDRYEDVVQSLPFLVYAKDDKGRYTMANQAFCDMVGLTREQIVGQNDLELGLFLNPDQILKADLQVFKSKQKKFIPLEPFTDRRGSLYWFQTTKIPSYNVDGEVGEILIISSDITKRIEEEQDLKKSELRYRSIFENNYSGIIVVDKDLKIQNKNSAFNQLVGATQKNFGSDDLKHYIVEDDKKDLQDIMLGMVSRNYEYFDLDLQLNTLSGDRVDTICFVRGLYNDHGTFSEAVVTFQDVTEAIKSRKALKESEERFRVIVEHATEAILLLDYHSKTYIDTNQNAEELFGYSRNELLTLHLGELSPKNQTSGEASDELSNAFMEKAIRGEHVVYDWIARRKDGRLLPCEVRLVRLPYPDQTIIRISVVDITERKKAEHLLNAEKRKLEESNNELVDLNHKLEDQTKQLQEFAYISSHNLRSPAGNIRALLDFYNSDPSEENLALLLDKLDIVSNDLMDTINDLADVVRIKNEISKEVSLLHIPMLIEKAKKSLSEQINRSNAVIELELNDIESIEASKAYMDSIVLNLMSNALKYSDEDRAPHIKISAEKKDGSLVLKFADNGLGIDMDKFGDKIFGLRKTFHRNRDSRGVGLFITKAQVEAMEGEITVSSKPNEGTTFTIVLPESIIK